MSEAELASIFQKFAAIGQGQATQAAEMDGARFAKLFKDQKMLDKKLTTTEVDIIFTKVKAKGARKIGFTEFQLALDEIAIKKSVSKAALIQGMLTAGGPVLNATEADAVKFHDDKSLYTGVYKNGGPINIDGPIDGLAGLTDRSPADVRGVKK